MSSIRKTKKYLIPTLLIAILAVSLAATFALYSDAQKTKTNPDAYIGVAFCGNTTEQAKLMVDRVKTYTNLFILDAGRNPISANETSVEEICDYAVNAGLSVIINMGWKDFDSGNNTWFWSLPSLEPIKQQWTQRWGDKFLGVYYNDEIGGVQLDANWREFFRIHGPTLNQIDHQGMQDMYQVYLKVLDSVKNGTKPADYEMEANFFVNDCVHGDLGLVDLNNVGIPAFTSDYCLYWWNYMGGFDVMFAELGWNNSVSAQIAQVKGAARLMDKDWGAMITWKYTTPPYLDNADEIYSQMLTSYEAGAKYIAVFDYPYVEGNDYGVLTDEQFAAMQRFWNDISEGKYVDKSAPEAALVLPHNYGWGLRNLNDTIWGFWEPDEKSPQVWTSMNTLLDRYGASLDIVFEDEAYPVSSGHYEHVYYWNQTIT
jgi:hypothetical protein